MQDQFVPATNAFDSSNASQQSAVVIKFLFFLGHARFVFVVKKIFLASEKIKFIFFLSILQRVSNLKPAGEGGDKAHVNKL